MAVLAIMSPLLFGAKGAGVTDIGILSDQVVQRCGRPERRTGRSRDAILRQPLGNLPERFTFGEFVKNALQDRCCLGVNLECRMGWISPAITVERARTRDHLAGLSTGSTAAI